MNDDAGAAPETTSDERATSDEAITPAEAERIADSVRTGTDTIPVPAALVDDAPAVEKTLLQRLKTMVVAERIKLALRGNRETRALLVRDGNRMVRRFVLQNPRITDDEIIALAKSRTIDDEMLREIADETQWTKNYQVRLALVTNPKTPLVIALRHMASIGDRDIRQLAKSKNVSQTIANAAKRIVITKDSQRGG